MVYRCVVKCLWNDVLRSDLPLQVVEPAGNDNSALKIEVFISIVTNRFSLFLVLNYDV